MAVCASQSALCEPPERSIKTMTEAAKVEINKSGFSFRLTDLDGRVVTNFDRRFKGKVVLVDVFGTWCPPCRKLAPFLKTLHEKYGEQGLEIVSIAFEKGTDKSDHLKKIKEFHREFGSDYTVLYGGSIADARDVLPLSVARIGFSTVILMDDKGTARYVRRWLFKGHDAGD